MSSCAFISAFFCFGFFLRGLTLVQSGTGRGAYAPPEASTCSCTGCSGSVLVRPVIWATGASSDRDSCKSVACARVPSWGVASTSLTRFHPRPPPRACKSSDVSAILGTCSTGVSASISTTCPTGRMLSPVSRRVVSLRSMRRGSSSSPAAMRQLSYSCSAISSARLISAASDDWARRHREWFNGCSELISRTCSPSCSSGADWPCSRATSIWCL
mmetsp:Transcript_130568/g.225794  ORF Transcript_130568/g.225794 Transcript_130568/m.225794 type:complete len:215 (-) Transcript_130568:2350-2994(-)